MAKLAAQPRAKAQGRLPSGLLSPRGFASRADGAHRRAPDVSFNRLPLQARLAIGPSDDRFEQEADWVAEHVMRSPQPSATGGVVRRACAACAEEEKLRPKSAGSPVLQVDAPPIVHQAMRSPGRPLDPGVRGFLEPRFGHDFRNVRIHTDPLASRSAEAIAARAYTVGSDIAFRRGEYAPDTAAGRVLLAHELAHVVQQGAAPGVVRRQEEDAGAPPQAAPAVARDLTEEDEKTCSPLYLQKLCVFIDGGFNGDRSGVASDDDMKNYNAHCRIESGYPVSEPDVRISDAEKAMLRSPKCARGDPEKARKLARDQRLQAIVDRSGKYILGGAGEELVRMVHDPLFQISVAAAITLYVALWVVPDPIISKIVAASATIALLSTGLFTLTTIYNFCTAWSNLQADADRDLTDDQIEEAARRFGTGLGAIGANLAVFLGSLLVGGKLPTPKNLPPAGPALQTAQRALTTPNEGGVVIRGPWGKGRVVPPSEPPPRAYAFDENGSPLKIYPAVEPEVLPQAEAPPQPAPAPKPAPNAGPGARPLTPTVPLQAGPDTGQKKRPPFVLNLPREKEPHLGLYRSYIGVIQSDPNYVRGNPAQRNQWHAELRLGGGHAIPAEVYERGHRLGFTGEEGEQRIRIPDWARTKASIPMEVDHVIELQVTPAALREKFDTIDNYELLDRTANGTSGPRLRGNIATERQKQEAFDPSLKGQILLFDQVQLDGGTAGQRWGVEEIRSGAQLDALEK